MHLWLLPVMIRLVVASCIFPIVLKHVTGQHSRPKRFALQFFFCAIAGTVILLVAGQPEMFRSKMMWLMIAIGAVNTFGTYCQWKAVDISLSKNSLFTIWDDIIAMTLSLIILKESQLVNAELLVGLTLCFLCVGLFMYRDFRTKLEKEEKEHKGHGKTPPIFYFYVFGYCVIWGVVIFLMKFLATKDFPIANFVFGWYFGAFISALAIFLFTERLRKNGRENSQTPSVPLTRRDVLMVMALSTCILLALATNYWAYMLAPQIVVQPLFLVGEMALPALIGLIVFKERKAFGVREWLYFSIGVLGGVLVALR